MKFHNLSLKQVRTLALTMARQARPKGLIIGLTGNLGSGKTTFVKAFATKFGIKKIHSPTFVITHQYRLGSRFLYHLDFYRLHTLKQLNPLGLQEILNQINIVLIEWADKFPVIANACDILIHFKVKPNHKRDVTIKFKN